MAKARKLDSACARALLRPACSRHRRVSPAWCRSRIANPLPAFSVSHLAAQRTFPDAEQQLFELGKGLRAELGTPFALNIAEDADHFRVDGASAPGQADNPGTSFAGRVGPDDITEALEAPEELVHRLLADPRALGEHAGANPIGTWKLQHRHMRYAKLLEARRVELLDDAALNGLARHAQ